MTLEERMQKIEAAFGAQSDLVRQLRDAVTVTAEMEAHQSRVLKEHSIWLVEHDRAIKEHEERMREHDERMKTLDVRIANLVSGIGEFMRRDRA
jgi:uncharacterized coiled-coil protein SlyX